MAVDGCRRGGCGEGGWSVDGVGGELAEFVFRRRIRSPNGPRKSLEPGLSRIAHALCVGVIACRCVS